MKFWVSVISFLVAGVGSITLLAWFGLPYVPLSESEFRDPYQQFGDLVGEGVLQGRTDHSGIEVTARSGGLAVGTAETDSQGSFRIEDVPVGRVDLHYFHPGYLRSNRTVNVQPEQTADAGVVKLLGGDTNDDGAVDVNDLWGIGARLVRWSRSTQAPEPSPSHGDDGGTTLLFNINGLGPVDVLDLALAGVNFGRQSPAACPAAVAGDSGGPVIMSHSVAQLSGNVLIYEVGGTADRPARFYAEYGNEAVGFLRSSKTDPPSTGGMVHMLRLRARSAYCYQLVAEDDQGRRSAGVSGQIRTAPLPQELQELTFTVQTGERTSYPLTIFEHNNPSFNGIVAIDDQAHLVWYYSEGDGRAVSALVQDPSTFDLLYQIGGFLGEPSAFIKEVNPLGELVRSSPEVCALPERPGIVDETGVHHEILAPVGGKVLYIGRAIADPLGTSDRLQQADTIREWDQAAGTDTVLWDAFDHLDATGDRTAESNSDGTRYWPGCIGTITNEDWTHGNSIQVAEPRGNIIMSFRSLDMIISRDPDFGSVEWRLGGPTSDFSFPDSGDRFYHQHTARQLPNGNTRSPAQGGEYSRGLELMLNTGSMTATKVWEYRHDPDLFAFCCSNTTRLTNGNTMMVFGCCFTHTLVEADSQGKTLFEAVIQAPMRAVQYRGYPADSLMGETAIGP